MRKDQHIRFNRAAGIGGDLNLDPALLPGFGQQVNDVGHLPEWITGMANHEYPLWRCHVPTSIRFFPTARPITHPSYHVGYYQYRSVARQT